MLDRDQIITSRYAFIRDKRVRDNESQLYFSLWINDIRQHIIKGKANDIHTSLIHLHGYLGMLLILIKLVCVSPMALYIELRMLAEPLDKGVLGFSGHRELLAPEGTSAILFRVGVYIVCL